MSQVLINSYVNDLFDISITPEVFSASLDALIQLCLPVGILSIPLGKSENHKYLKDLLDSQISAGLFGEGWTNDQIKVAKEIQTKLLTVAANRVHKTSEVLESILSKSIYDDLANKEKLRRIIFERKDAQKSKSTLRTRIETVDRKMRGQLCYRSIGKIVVRMLERAEAEQALVESLRLIEEENRLMVTGWTRN